MKDTKFTRRRFIGLASAISAVALFPASFFKKISAQTLAATSEIIKVHGNDPYRSTIKAVDALGGMSEFVKKGNKVGLLINGNFSNPGTYTNPDISLAVLKMCFDAGAGEVMLIRADREDIWQKSAYYDSHMDLLEKTTRSAGNKVYSIEKGIVLKEAEMIRELFELDTLINIPVAKNHDAAYLTCCLKNMMGLCARSTNVLFHSPDGSPRTDNNRLAHCIADVNTVRQPDLSIVDATTFLVTNGPHGPGEVMEAGEVLAGTDPVALDAFCAGYHDYEPGMVISTEYAANHKLGESDLERISVKEINLT